MGGSVSSGNRRGMVWGTFFVVATTLLSHQASAQGLTNQWIDLEESERYVARHECSFIQAGNKFYLFGGRENATRVDRYDYASDTWDTAAPVPLELNHFQALVYEGLIWVIGAFSSNNYPYELPATRIYVYDPAKNVWMEGPIFPAARRRGGAGLVVYNHQFYIVGGSTTGHNGSVAFFDRFDPRSNEWAQLPDAPNARDHFAAVLVDDQLYNIGGRATNITNVFANTRPMIDVYDFVNANWTTLPGLSLAVPRAGTSSVYFGGKILLIGGEATLQSAAYNRVDAFDPVTKTLTQVASLKYPRHGTQAFVSGPGVIIAGGSPTRGGGNQRNMEAYSMYAPFGVASTAGVLTGSVESLSIYKDQVEAFSLSHSSGNTGIFVNNITFQGPDAIRFSLALPAPSLPFLLGQGETRQVSVTYSGNKGLATANLTVTYSGIGTLVIPLQGINPDPTPTVAPLTLPPVPTFRWGTTCFAANGNTALRSAIRTYINEVQTLPTLEQRLNHNISIMYGYPIGYWCTRQVTSFSSLFDGFTTFNEPLTFWNTSMVTTMAQMFRSASAFNQYLSHFVTSRVTDMQSMFRFARSFTGSGVEHFDTSRVTTMAGMFFAAASFNGNISRWNTSRVVSMNGMFSSAENFNHDISNWNTRLVVDARSMFQGAARFNQNLCAWGSRMTNATNFAFMFFSTSCPFRNNDPNYKLSPSGPFCHDCCCRPTLPNRVDGPIEVPLVPAAASNIAHTGRVLAWSARSRYQYGGSGMGTFTTIFDPDTGNSTLRKVESTNHDMFCPGTSTLADGRLVVTGGQTNIVTSIYNPWNDTWSQGPKMNIGRGYQSQVTLADGSVFVFGGSWNGGLGGKHGEVYTEQNNGTRRWTTKPGIQAIGDVNTNDTAGIYRSDSHMWLFEATDGRIFKAGPARRMHWINITGNGTVTPSVLRGDDRDAMNGNAVYFDLDKIFTVGGAELYDRGPGSDRAYVIDISGPEAVVERQQNMLFARTFSNSVVLPNGNILVIGGQSKVDLFKDTDGVLNIEMFVPEAKRFFELRQPLKTPRNYHSIALLLKDGRVLAGGGGLCGNNCDYFTSYNHPDFEIITPPYLLDAISGNLSSSRPVIVSAPSVVTPGGTISVVMDTAALTTTTTFSLVRTGSVTHGINLDQRRVPLTVLSQESGGGNFTLQVPASPVHVPPGMYWLFAMDAAGVPSIGHTMIRTI